MISWKLPLERLSASSMGLAVQCPEQFRQRYIVREKDSDIMFGSRFVGIVDHKVNEAILRRGQNEIVVESIYQKVWNEQIEKLGEPDWREDNPVKMMETGVKMAKLYHTVAEIKPVALEKRFEVRVPGVPVPIVGFIDVEEAHQIRERKTTGVKTTKAKAKWRFQGVIYQYAVGMPVTWDVVTRQVTPQVFLGKDWDGLRMEMVGTKVSYQLVRDAAKRISDLYNQYGPDHPWPMNGIFNDWLCDYCVVGPKYERTCPVWQTLGT